MKKILFFVGVGVAALTLVSGAALAFGPNGPGGPEHGGRGEVMMKKMMEQRLDEALAAASAAPAQRAAIHQIAERVFATIGGARHEGVGQRPDPLAIFEQDKIDRAKLTEMRAEHATVAEKVGDVVVGALKETHDLFTHAQRQALVGFVSSQLQAHAGNRHHEMHQMMQKHLDEALAVANLTPQQKALVDASRANVRAALEGAMPGEADHVEAMKLFVADRWDEAGIAQLRAHKMTAMLKAADAVQQSITEVHDALSPEQRQAVAGYLRAQRAKHEQRMHEHFHGEGGPRE